MHAEIAVLAQRLQAAARAVGVTLLLANIYHQARMKCAAINRIRQHQPEPIRIAAGDGHIAQQYLRLHAAGQMHQMNLAPKIARRCEGYHRGGRRSRPTTEHLFNLREHRISGKIADDDEQRIRRRIIVVIELFELRMLDGFHLFLRRGDNRVWMLAENHAAKSFVRQKIRA